MQSQSKGDNPCISSRLYNGLEQLCLGYDHQILFQRHCFLQHNENLASHQNEKRKKKLYAKSLEYQENNLFIEHLEGA